MTIPNYEGDKKKINLFIKNRGQKINDITFYEVYCKKKEDTFIKETTEISIKQFISIKNKINTNKKQIDSWEKNEVKELEIEFIDDHAYKSVKYDFCTIQDFLFCFEYYDLRMQKRNLELRIAYLRDENSFQVHPEIMTQSDISNTAHKENRWLSKE